MSRSKARYSAPVSAIRGVAMRSMGGSLARLRKRTARSMAPVCPEVLDEEVRFLEGDAHGAEDDGELLLLSRAPSPGGRSGRRCGGAAGRYPEKMGSFWPRTSVFRPSMDEMPVWMNSVG